MWMIREFFETWREWGLHVAAYNLGFRILHRHDDHVRVWQDGEMCPGCNARH